jgi:hypothetical protein
VNANRRIHGVESRLRFGPVWDIFRCCAANRNEFSFDTELSTDLRVGWVGVAMKARFLAVAVVCSIILIAVGAAFREANPVAPRTSAEADFDERWISISKGDRLPLPSPTPFAVAAVESEIAPPAAAPPEQPLLATEDDMRQAEAEHHRHSDICRHGRTYFTIQHHQYWRCM